MALTFPSGVTAQPPPPRKKQSDIVRRMLLKSFILKDEISQGWKDKKSKRTGAIDFHVKKCLYSDQSVAINKDHK